MNRPNIVFITSHDLGKTLGCYNNPTVQSPAIDKLAKQGVKFENAFTTAPQCSPSRSSLHTGRYSHANGVMGLAHSDFGWELNNGEKHIASLLKDAGYHTTLIGVQHLTKTPEKLGYDSIIQLEPANQLAHAADEVINSYARDERPFYLEIGFFETHRPFDYGMVEPDYSKGVEIPPYLPNSETAKAEMAALQGAIVALDQGVGKILDSLKKNGLSENTWLVFTTDHGVAMPRAKATLYDPGLQTALLMRWPAAGLKGNVTFHEMISNVDLVPTILEGLELPIPENIQGRSFWSLLKGSPYQERDEIYCEKNFHTYYEPMRGIRTKNYKLIVNMEVSTQVDVPSDIRRSPLYPSMINDFIKLRPHIELYDLKFDPLEKNNLAGFSEVAEIEKQLKRRLLSWMRETEDPILKGPIASPYYYDALDQLIY